MTPDEIRSREFFVSADGYDRAEVRRYLGQLADEREAGAWAVADDRLLLVLEAARRAVDAVAADARRAAVELRQIVRDELRAALGAVPTDRSRDAVVDQVDESSPPATSQTDATRADATRADTAEVEIDQVRIRLEEALARVERAIADLGG